MSLRDEYRELNDRVFALYESGKQEEALRRLDDAESGMSLWRAELAYLRACLHGSLGQHAAALGALESAVADGAWWDPSVLEDDDDLAGARELPTFGSLLEASAAGWRKGNAFTDRSGDQLLVPAGSAHGVVVALHSAEEDASDAVLAWGSVVKDGFALHAVRSSQRTSPNYRTWPDKDRAFAELEEARGQLPEELRRLPVVVAGFSAGGRVALHWALTSRPCPVAGVIAVSPAISAECLPTASSADLAPARILVGADDDLASDVRAVARRLEPARFTLDIIPGVGHAFPPDFSTRLAAWLR